MGCNSTIIWSYNNQEILTDGKQDDRWMQSSCETTKKSSSVLFNSFKCPSITFSLLFDWKSNVIETRLLCENKHEVA